MGNRTTVYLFIFRSRPFSRSHIGRYWYRTVSTYLVSLHRIPSYPSSVPWASIPLVSVSYGYSMELLFYSSRYPADISWTFPRIIKERECGYPSYQQIPTSCLRTDSSHSCLRLTWQMSLSRELSVDSQVTCCGENMLEESEDFILNQVAFEISNRVNNPKGEER